MEIWKMKSWKSWNMEKSKSEKMDMRKKDNWTLGEMVFGEKEYWEKWKSGTIQKWKYANL